MSEPKLRFKRDDGTVYPEWEKLLIGSIYRKNMERNDKCEFPFSKTISIASMRFNEKGNGAEDASLASYKVLRVGDIAFEGHTNKQFAFGRFVLNDIGDGIISPRFSCLRPKKELVTGFWKYYIHHESIMRPILVRSTKMGTMMNELAFDDLAKQNICVPCLEEQQKIADFLSDLDAVISASEAEVASLEQQKKGAMQKIFSQEVRFRRDDGTEYPAWEDLCLSEIVEPNNIPVENPGSNYVKLAIRSHCKGTFHKPVNSDDEGLDVDTMYLVEAYNLIVNITFAWEHAIAITKLEDAGTYVSHRFPQYKFVNGNLPSFYEYVIRNPRMKYEMGLCSPGGAGRNRVLNLKDFMKIQVIRPCPEEQQRIADFLSSFDESIALARQELEKWKLLKRGLMQQMFV